MFPFTRSLGFYRCISLLQTSSHNALTLKEVERKPVLLASFMGETLHAFIWAEQTELWVFLWVLLMVKKVEFCPPEKGGQEGRECLKPPILYRSEKVQERSLLPRIVTHSSFASWGFSPPCQARFFRAAWLSPFLTVFLRKVLDPPPVQRGVRLRDL